MDQSPEQVVRAYLDAFAACDFARARRFLSDTGFRYRSPISRFDNADDFIADVSRVGAILESIEIRKTFVQDNDVCSILDFKVRMDRLVVATAAQVSTVVDGRIVAIESIFDATEYARLFDVE